MAATPAKLAAIAALMALAACGGGGDGGGTTAVATAPGTGVTATPAPAPAPAPGPAPAPSPSPSASPPPPAPAPSPSPSPSPSPPPAAPNTSEQLVDAGGTPSLTALPNSFAVSWVTLTDECVRRYSGDGNAVSASSCTPELMAPSLVGLANGDVVALNPVRTRIEHADGSWSAPFAISSQSTSTVSQLSGAAMPDGTWYATWASGQSSSNTQIVLRHFAADGTPLSSDIEVASATATIYQFSAVFAPAAGALADGTLVVTWMDPMQEMKARRYAANGTPLSAEFDVGPSGGLAFQPTHVVGLAGGGFVIVYMGPVAPRAQVFTADGTKVGPLVDVAVPPDVSNQQCGQFPCRQTDVLPSAAALADGGFVVAWNVQGNPQANTVEARRFNADGSAAGPVTQVSSQSGIAAPRANWPGVAALPNSNFAFAWQYEAGQQPSGIFLRLYGAGALK